jgi:hypothetical protein
VNALTEDESFGRLGDLPRPRQVVVTTVDEAVAFARTIDGPVVAKVCGVAHKSEVGGVRLGLDADGVAACFGELAGAGNGMVMVVEQVKADYELLVGAIRDEQFGPVISIGVGGVLTEALRDTTMVLSPLEPGELDAALARIAANRLFDGYRGFVPLDVEALEIVVDAVGLLMERDASVIEVDLNPVAIVRGKPVVLDALVVTG